MSKKDNIAFAKKHLVGNIYSSAKLENINITYPQTQTILQGGNISGLSLSDLEKVINLRDAWKYTLEKPNEIFDLDFICKINSFIARNESIEWGVLRNGQVGISGVDFIPKIPIKEKVNNDIRNILNETNPVERALDYFLYGTKNQLFWDGNKRTSWVCTNKLLIDEGKGIFLVKETDLEEFNKKLSHYYETDDKVDIKNFLLKNAIHLLSDFLKQNLEIDKEIENRKMHEMAIDKLDLNVKQEQNKKQSINKKI